MNAGVNNLALIAAYVWMWTGFCMVILSAALKSIPDRCAGGGAGGRRQ